MYIAQYSVTKPAESTSYLTLWLTSLQLELLLEDYSFTHPPLSRVRYSFIQLSELRQSGLKQISQALRWQRSF